MCNTGNPSWRASLFASLAWLVPAFVLAGTPFQLDRGAAPDHPQQPQVAVDEQGAIHIVYGTGNLVRYRRSNDNGETFTEPVDLNSASVISLGMRRGPRIAAPGRSLCVTVIGGKQGKGRDGDVLAMRSIDGGKSWSRPVRVNDRANSAREGLHAMAAGPNGELCCVWLDLRSGSTEIMASTSANGGGVWSGDVLIYRSPDGSVCECCHPSVAYDSRGRIIVLWRNSIAGARDMYVASSTDGGETFGHAEKLGLGSWPLDACPMDGGALAADVGGKLASVWRREKSIYLSLADQREERLLGAGEQPWMTATNEGPYVVWLRKRGDVAYLRTPERESPIELAPRASDPVIASGPLGRGPVVAAWESLDGRDRAIHCQVIVK